MVAARSAKRGAQAPRLAATDCSRNRPRPVVAKSPRCENSRFPIHRSPVPPLSPARVGFGDLRPIGDVCEVHANAEGAPICRVRQGGVHEPGPLPRHPHRRRMAKDPDPRAVRGHAQGSRHREAPAAARCFTRSGRARFALLAAGSLCLRGRPNSRAAPVGRASPFRSRARSKRASTTAMGWRAPRCTARAADRI